MLTWKDVVFKGKIDGCCEQCNKSTRKDGYDRGAWLQDVFYCHDCLEKRLGPIPEPGCPIGGMQSDDNPFTFTYPDQDDNHF